MKHSEKELIEIYKDLKDDALHVEYFIRFYESAFDEISSNEDDWSEDKSAAEHTLEYCLKFYLAFFIKFLKEGHGVIWSNRIANLVEIVKDSAIMTYTVRDPFVYAYREIKKENPELAWKEINIYCNSLSNDKIFKKYYLFLVENNYETDIKNKGFNY